MSLLAEIAERENRLLCPTYTRYPLHIVQGHGARIKDAQGREYVDLLAGIAVCNLGHCHPEVTQTICEQAARLVHLSNLFYQTPQLDLAEKLLDSCGLERVFFCNSGAEANEAAIKLARRFAQEIQGRQAWEIITVQGSFHGRTLATLAATGQEKIQKGFAPLPSGFVTVPFADTQALEAAVNPQTVAVMLEVIQGEGGVRPAPAEYLLQVQELCARHDLLLILDEVQTGMGRTGQMWAHQHTGIRPDIMTVAKGLGNGLPIGAMLCTEKLSQGFSAGSHATTFGGGPLIAAAGAKVLEIIDRDGICSRAQALGQEFKDLLQEVKIRHRDKIREVRGQGFMLGVELTQSGPEIWQALLDRGFICNLTQNTVLRLLPPLVIEEHDLRAFADALDQILKSLNH
ncbi:MAG: acetylornithine transaminase [Thermodesulfobacteriota bacterium]